MKRLLVGHSIVDEIDGAPPSPGGLFYAAAALASTKRPEEDIALLTGADAETPRLFAPVYQAFRADLIVRLPRAPRVRLTLRPDGEREERYEFRPAPLPLDEVHENFDALYLNLTTGEDVDPDALARYRRRSDCGVYLDAHTLARGWGKRGERTYRDVEDFPRWARSIDVLQVNERELLSAAAAETESDALARLFAWGVSRVVVTRAERGAELFRPDAPPLREAPPDPTDEQCVGCGDVFGAVFFYWYFVGFDEREALRRAVSAANRAARARRREDLYDLRDDETRRPD
jgi:sugar/nucleoside kinase (ribokinase family)